VFHIKPYHSDSVTKTNIKHRFVSIANSTSQSGAQTPAYIDGSLLSDSSGGKLFGGGGAGNKMPIPRTLDEQADSAARKCIMYFGPGNNPRLSIAPRNQVAVDAGGKIHLLDDLEEYRKTVGPRQFKLLFAHLSTY
jgi:alpha,alpha-trehalose phosphorylase (configuration-retaining)